jgi:integrase
LNNEPKICYCFPRSIQIAEREGFSACNTIGHSVSRLLGGGRKLVDMSWRRLRQSGGLAGKHGRKYLNAAERKRFLAAAANAVPMVRLFCSTLMWSGCRISELLALTPAAIDLDEGVATIQTLKRRVPGVFRQVPLPSALVLALEESFDLRAAQHDPLRSQRPLWTWSRSTAWRHVKTVMKMADIVGAAAMPKGLRHTFGVAAFQSSVPPHIVQRWLGHASLETTAIYGDVAGKEERDFASRIWNGW